MTLLIGFGADIKTVQQCLGHSSVSLIMDIYAHFIAQNDREAADAIGEIISTDKHRFVTKSMLVSFQLIRFSLHCLYMESHKQISPKWLYTLLCSRQNLEHIPKSESDLVCR